MLVIGQLVLLLLVALRPVHAAVTVSAVVDHQRVYVGESFVLQIQVEGNDSPTAPDLAALSGFTVTPQGGQKNNSTSVSIMNGHVTRVTRSGYIFNYTLTPPTAGHLIIPDLEIKVDGVSYFTLPITIEVMPPHETKDFKLRIGLEKGHCYIGEPIKLTVTWYVGKDVKGFNFNLPIMSDKRFSIRPDTTAPTKADQKNLLTIPLTNGTVVARKGNGSLKGRDFLTVSFSQILVPLVSGQLALPVATVSAHVLATRQPRGNLNNPFGSFFNDNFFGHSQDIYRTMVVPSKALTLEVLPLPQKGQPSNFNGLVGDYSLLVSASPTKVKVGDPITLTIQVAGDYTDNVTLPPLPKQLPTRNFKVPNEMAPGVGQGMLKTFTQTVRIRRPGVKEIPPLSLSFFNVKSGQYETVYSKTVAMQVSGNKIITASDAEGETNFTVTKRGLHAVKGGINYNYEDADVLVNHDQYGGEPNQSSIVLLVGLPPVICLLLFMGLQINQRRHRNPLQRRSRKAYKILQTALHALQEEPTVSRQSYEGLGLALHSYLAAKLALNPAVLTYSEVEIALRNEGITPTLMSQLQELLAQCEAGQYAGGMINNRFNNLLVMAAEVGRQLEKGLKSNSGMTRRFSGSST